MADTYRIVGGIKTYPFVNVISEKAPAHYGIIASKVALRIGHVCHSVFSLTLHPTCDNAWLMKISGTESVERQLVYEEIHRFIGHCLSVLSVEATLWTAYGPRSPDYELVVRKRDWSDKPVGKLSNSAKVFVMPHVKTQPIQTLLSGLAVPFVPALKLIEDECSMEELMLLLCI